MYLMDFPPCNGYLHSFSMSFLILKWVRCSVTTNNATSSSLSMKSYKLLNWKLRNEKLFRAFSLASLKFKNVKVQIKSRNITCLSYAFAIWRAFSFPTYQMTNPNPLYQGSNIIPNMLWVWSLKRNHKWKEGFYNYYHLFCMHWYYKT